MVDPLPLIRTANGILGPLAPSLSSRVALRMFSTPRHFDPPARERDAERAGERIEVGPGSSAVRWRGGDRGRVLAMHGWEGRATQWGPMATAFAAAGYEFVALDGPAHGHSAGRRANPPAFARALARADHRLGPFDALIGHSMGGAATAIALRRGFRAERVVLIASPAALADVLRRFATFVGLPAVVERRFVARVEAQVGQPASAWNIADMGAEFSQPSLIVHSRDDREIPFADAEAIVAGWSDAALLAVDGLGHRRVLRDVEVIDRVRAFVDRRV